MSYKHEFVKIGSRSITREYRAKLIVQGQELLKTGDTDNAYKIFLAVKHKAGLIQLGQHHAKTGDILKSFEMFSQAEAKEELSQLCRSSAAIIRIWLSEDK